jgi:ubiquinone/menaquinone biosynthesis C-methylase UbiE
VTALLRNLNVLSEPSAKIIELGSGTGKFTSLIAERDEGYEVLAVEPHDEMRAELEKKIPGWEATGHGKVISVKGNAEDIKGVENESADAVVASQSFHWYLNLSLYCVGHLHHWTNLIKNRFANKSALKEMHRVLKVGGVLGLIWNIEDCKSHY